MAQRNLIVATSLILLVTAHYFGIDAYVLTNILAFGLVSIGIESRQSKLWMWLENSTLRHFGKISYGIYVYHYFVPAMVDPRLHFGNISAGAGMRILRFLVLVLISIGIAETSWWLMEKPILKMKDRIG